MKKRMLSILLTLCMVLSLLPATALADGVDTEENYLIVSDWDGLLSAMETIENTTANPVYKGIKIKGNNFGWPDEGGTLVIDFEDDRKTTTGKSGAGNQYYIYIVEPYGAGNCTWEIPANVTLQCYERLYLGDSYGATSTVTLNGTLEFMDSGTFGNNWYPYASANVTVNGTLNTSAGTNSTNLTNVGLTVSNSGTLNVLYRCNLGEVNIAAGATVNIGATTTVSGTLTLADGVHLTGKTLSLQGDLTTPGSAVVDNYLQIYHNSTARETITLSGNLVLGSVYPYGTSPVLTIPEGSNVSLERFANADAVTVKVGGVLDITGGHSSFDGSTITIQSGGTVKMQPSVQFDDEDSNSTIGGEGTLELYGILREWDDGDLTCERCPSIFGTYSDRTDGNGDYVALTGVDENTLTVKRMWDTCTGHSWGEVTTVAPTCGDRGYDTATCTKCGTEKRSNYVAPTDEHTPSYEAWASNPSKVTVECSVCGQMAVITITAADGVYANGAPVETATLNNVPEWLTAPAIVYTNNTEVGTATASATFGDVTIYVTFEISDCAHENVTAATCTAGPTCSDCGKVLGEPLGHTGGTATCREQATCTRCGEKYGKTGYHTYALKFNADMHWVECSVCGLDCLQDYGLDVTSPSQLPNEVLLEMIYAYFEQQGGGTIEQSIYLEQYGDEPSRHAYSSTDGDACLLCGYTETTYTLSFETNGGSKIESVTKLSGATIDLAEYVPTRTGYDFEGWYSDAKLTDKITSVKLTRDMTVYAKWTKKGGENPFADVAEGTYYANAVIWAVGEGITSGTSATTFSPDDPCTRAQIVAFLWRVAGRPEPETTKNPFTDVKSTDYFYKAVLWASENGIVYGTSGTTFSPNQGCTRGQVAAFLWRAAGRPEPTTGNNPFTDVKTSEYYGKAVVWAAENKIVYGTSATEFSPNAICTRAQIVTFLYRTYAPK